MKDSWDQLFGDLQDQGCIQSASHFRQIDSTNLAARRYATESSQQLPALFVADRQTQGRGRSDHSWWSPEGCLMMTLLTSCRNLPAQRDSWSQLALVTGVSAARAIEALCPAIEVKLKWPNDLFVHGKKLGGILIESMLSSGEALNQPANREQLFAIGIGINVDVNWQSAPNMLASRATCLSTAVARSIRCEVVLHQLVQELSQMMRRWQDSPSCWHETWHQRCLLTGKWVTIDQGAATNGRLVDGRCEGVAHDGRLLIRLDSGHIQAIQAGEVVQWS